MARPPAAARGMEQMVSEVAAQMRSGASVADVEHDLIQPSRLDAERKAALWLYAWSGAPDRRRRQDAVARVLMLTRSGSHLG